MARANEQRARIVRFQRPPLYRKQREAIFNERRISIIEASTKSGKTVGCLAWLAEQALMARTPHQNFWWVAPIYSQAEIAFLRLKRFLPAAIYIANETKLTMKFPNGSTIFFKSAEKPDALYGEDVVAAVIDEASRVKEASWYAVRSTLTHTQGKIRIIGNVKGRGNWFYKLGQMAKGGDQPGMTYHKITALDAVCGGIIKPEELADSKRLLPLHIWLELYMCIASDDGGNPFGINEIAACVGPMSDDPPDVWGWDFAKSSDWTVGIALDRAGRVCRFERFRRPWQETIQKVSVLTGETYAMCDSTGVGDPIVEALQRPGFEMFEVKVDKEPGPWVFDQEPERQEIRQIQQRITRDNFAGFKFSASSKQQLMEGLRLVIQRREITIPDGTIRDELDAFEYEYRTTSVRYSAPEGMHDDCVCALALAVLARRTKPAEAMTW